MITREPHFCAHCNRTTYWEVRGDTLVCIGDQRAKLPGCYTIAPLMKVKRFVGECVTCKRLRRGSQTKELNYLCLYCWHPMENTREVEFGDLTGF